MVHYLVMPKEEPMTKYFVRAWSFFSRHVPKNEFAAPTMFVRQITRYVPWNETILAVGETSRRMAMRLSKQQETHHLVPRFKRWPYTDESFDNVILTTSPKEQANLDQFLEEAARVAIHRVIVLENIPLGSNRYAELRAHFHAHGLRVEHEETWSSSILNQPSPSTMFILVPCV